MSKNDYDPYLELMRELGKIVFEKFDEELLKKWDILENDGKFTNIIDRVYRPKEGNK